MIARGGFHRKGAEGLASRDWWTAAGEGLGHGVSEAILICMSPVAGPKLLFLPGELFLAVSSQLRKYE